MRTSDEVVLSEHEKVLPLGDANFKFETNGHIFQPIYHLMDSTAAKAANYKFQVLYAKPLL